MKKDKPPRSPEIVRAACLHAARRAYDEAMQSGLCAEGALEAALGAIEMLDLDEILQKQDPQEL